MVNPDISLFHPVPEGALTYQPNANSIVQNDEARGVDHLDFFRFVGRIVGKALFDGQHIDAYFTRSFYKHMLGQRLTYQVRLAGPVPCCRGGGGSWRLLQEGAGLVQGGAPSAGARVAWQRQTSGLTRNLRMQEWLLLAGQMQAWQLLACARGEEQCMSDHRAAVPSCVIRVCGSQPLSGSSQV